MKRASSRGDALLYLYKGDQSVARAVNDHISGLTMGYYAHIFQDLDKVFPDEGYRELAERFANAILLSASEGGPTRILPQVVGIEELPLETPDLILNGWQSALVSLIDSRIPKQNSSLLAYIEKNVEFLRSNIARYDLPEIANTRYSLAGPVLFKVSSVARRPFVLAQPRLLLDGEEYERFTLGSKSGWQNVMFDKDVSRVEDGLYQTTGNAVRFNCVLSNVFSENVITLRLGSGQEHPYEVSAYVGEYTPTSAGMVGRNWEAVGTFAGTQSEIRCAVPEKVMQLVGAPTNFLKVFSGRRRNVYHVIHANRMHDLFQRTGIREFRDAAFQWASYVGRWAEMAPYSSLTVHDHRPYLRSPLRTAY